MNSDRDFWTIVAICVVYLLAVVALWGGIAYVALHFILKAW